MGGDDNAEGTRILRGAGDSIGEDTAPASSAGATTAVVSDAAAATEAPLNAGVPENQPNTNEKLGSELNH